MTARFPGQENPKDASLAALLFAVSASLFDPCCMASYQQGPMDLCLGDLTGFNPSFQVLLLLQDKFERGYHITCPIGC